jgi:hypothetical protein
VRAETDLPLVFFDTQPDSGYSVDNLVPSAPQNPRLTTLDILAWDEVLDLDFDYYTVYASETEDFTSTSIVGMTTNLSLDVSGTTGDYLAVTATDFSGNESQFSIIVRNLTDTPESSIPAIFALHPNKPNPFNPATIIQYDLPRASRVTLRIYDISGRLIRNLRDALIEDAGSYEVTWHGCDNTGRPVASGTYIYRLTAGGYTETRSMVLVK